MSEVVEAGIDYLAMTMPLDSESGPRWGTAAQGVIDLLIAHGNVPRVGNFRGYEGVWCAGAFYGVRDTDQHIHVAGGFASRVWSQLHHDSAHYSRLDLQVTVRTVEYDADVAKRAFVVAEAHNALRPKAQQRKIHLHTSNDGGSTVYIGSRKSEHFCRIYNKAAQSEDEFYANCWRYELELHNSSATDAARYIYNGSRTQPRVSASTVWRYLHERGLQPDWSRESEENAVLPRSTARSDFDRKLDWLRTQVGPTVELLLQHIPATVVLEALRIGRDAEPLPVENQQQG